MSILCNTFKRESSRTWNRLKAANETGLSLQEESITDNLLIDLKTSLRDRLLIKKFNKKEESKTGADWEWWFQGKNKKWVGLRVQAKKICNKLESYEHLFYKQGTQLEALIKNALKSSPPKIPIYCLFTYSNKDPKFLRRKYPNIPHKMYGCSFLLISEILSLRNNSTRIENIFPKLMPWHIPFCIQTGGKGTQHKQLKLIDNIIKYFKNSALQSQYYLLEKQGKAAKLHREIETGQLYILKDPPDYVIKMISGNEFTHPDPELDFLIVYSEIPIKFKKIQPKNGLIILRY